MKFTAAQIADIIKGEIIGNEETTVSDFGRIEDAGKDALTFLANEKYKDYLPQSNASLIVVSKDISFSKNGKTYIIVDDAYTAMTTLLNVYESFKSEKSGIEQPSSIAETAKLGDNIYVGAFAYIGENVTIGKNCKIYPHVFIGDNVVIGDNSIINSGAKIYQGCEIGNNCVIHAGTIIGSDGFGFQPDDKGVFHKVPQIGNVVIKDNVEIGANCTIDRATMGSTIIEEGVKLDNLIQIAHNVTIGKNTVIASQTGIAGSTKIGENNIIGGQVGIAGHLTLGNHIQIQAQSGLNTDIADHSRLYGSPAMDAMDFRKSYVYFRKLPALMRKLNQLDKKINQERKDG